MDHLRWSHLNDRKQLGGGTTPLLSQIRLRCFLSSTGVTLVTEWCHNWQLDRTNSISIDVKAVHG